MIFYKGEFIKELLTSWLCYDPDLKSVLDEKELQVLYSRFIEDKPNVVLAESMSSRSKDLMQEYDHILDKLQMLYGRDFVDDLTKLGSDIGLRRSRLISSTLYQSRRRGSRKYFSSLPEKGHTPEEIERWNVIEAIWLWVGMDNMCIKAFREHEFDFLERHFINQRTIAQIAKSKNLKQQSVRDVLETCLRKTSESYNESLASFLREYHESIEGKSEKAILSKDFYHAQYDWLK